MSQLNAKLEYKFGRSQSALGRAGLGHAISLMGYADPCPVLSFPRLPAGLQWMQSRHCQLMSQPEANQKLEGFEGLWQKPK